MPVKKLSAVLGVVMLASMIVTACLAPQPQPIMKAVTQDVAKIVEKAGEDYTKPHPILSDVRVRQAIAYCTNRDELIAAVYPFIPAEQRAELHMDSFLPKSHWAYKGPYTDYPYNQAEGIGLLEEAGWKLKEGADVRTNEAGDVLALKFTTTEAQFRQTWAAVMEQNLKDCGIQLIRQNVPASWWFGDTTGLARRDFELGGYSWIGQADPGMRPQYACNQIPLPSNNWAGQNYMGWCNETASKAVVAANNTLNRGERIKYYDIVQKEFAKNMVSLPLFQRLDAEAWNPSLEGIRVSPTEYATKSAKDWKMSDGSDTVVIGFSQEPASMFSLVESAAVQRQAYDLGVGTRYTQYNYDFQPALQAPLSTIENGLSKNAVVDVKAGDMVYTSGGDRARLEQGVRVFDADGNEVEYYGSSPLKMQQLTSTYKLKPFTWSDGTKGTIGDLALGYRIHCDRQTGAANYEVCDQIQGVEFGDTDLEYTVTWLPGAQYSLYFLAPFFLYPSFQKLGDGRMLADVPPNEWAALPEIAEKPLSYAPFAVLEWKKGEGMTFVRNEYFEPKPALSKVVVRFFPDSQSAVAALMRGDVDYLERLTLGAGTEVQTVVDAQTEGKLKVELIPSPSWEHVDFNLFTK
jgi:ABC-type transport system substrate-binding protein